MKKLLILAFAITIVSCKKETPVDYAIVSGTVTNTSSEKLTLYNELDFSYKKEIKIADNGSFIDTISINKSGFYFLAEKRNKINLYLNQEDKVAISFNAKKIDSTLTITGSNSKINNYLANKTKLAKDIRVATKKLYSKDEKEFLADLAMIKEKQKKLLAKSKVSKNFNDLEAKNINFEYLSYLNNYKDYHSYFTKNKEFDTSKGFSDALNDLDYTDENNFNFSSSYRNLLSSHYRNEAEKLVEKDSLKSNDIAYLETLASIKSQTIKNKMLYDDAKYGITHIDNLEEYYKIYSNASTNIANNEKITKSYNSLKVISKGNPSPKFINYENNAGGITSLDDLNGKYVYVDVWATWCGPCIAQIPSLKKIEKQYHGKNIEFVSISIDAKKDHDKWKKMIIDKELGGIQLYADNSWESEFVEGYMIKGIPRFILIDPQGNIVSANAPRPSSEKLIELFNKNKI